MDKGDSGGTPGCPICRGPLFLKDSERTRWNPTQYPKQMLAMMILERAELVLRTHFHDAPRNMAMRRVLLHPAMHSQVPWDTWPRDADHWATYFLRLWECMGPPPDLLRQAGSRWGAHTCRSGHLQWLDVAHWSQPSAAMPWGPNNDEFPGSCMEEVNAYLVTHPDIAVWRWAYRALYLHWLHGETLPARYLDASLQHLCGGLT